MKRFAFFSLIVIGIIPLQSCFKSRSQIASEAKHTAPATTAIKGKNIVLTDTAITETSLFIAKVDDEKGLAYGNIFEFDNAQATEIKVVVPYDCIRFDNDSKGHYLLVKPFVKALLNNDVNVEAYAYIERRQLVGYDTNK